ncbi:MAG: hypothetical protein A2275_18875 [Bacteroidetes bacterium RIFOXYA12_FULL_35_11]|nr:MAG: hypothetical protein A2X01_12135 [Bacteroidetes bacterium GWF2_35_48]OFY73012.1 MAG: hypothetical protein A2275_18875 [Bacteroidetes bacterium RIFOXYA12_FULL_35_11]OFY96545.1 MAG: hypothetical protein A2309_14450 [Bacteroidetes bacterium RIFOXYB2_FULL_35_7]OFZ05119.1 MAG: hypothetical protein A2491_07415 [Bacteroidetes bacterium RIFOXYC12_FULL_35_7]HBX49485.1 hypothetical protein [Bacteroidales bacterium]
MKFRDLVFFSFLILLFLPFFIFTDVFNFYDTFNRNHPLITSFIKFAVLATAGECLGLRIKTGNYNHKGFGIIPRAIVWGFLGITIQMAFAVFSSGVPVFLTKTLDLPWALHFLDKQTVLSMSIGEQLIVAFSISVSLNLIFAPVMMTFHKITDTHIINNGGTIAGLFKPIKFKEIFKNLNWVVQWNFVFKKTIPFFWIPMHTITFMLAPEYRVLFAALLGIALGVILAVSNQSKK